MNDKPPKLRPLWAPGCHVNAECPKCEGEGGWWIGHGGNETEMVCEDCRGTGKIDQ